MCKMIYRSDDWIYWDHDINDEQLNNNINKWL